MTDLSIFFFVCNRAIKALLACGVRKANIDVLRVPGAFELPFAAKVCPDPFAGVASHINITRAHNRRIHRK